MSDVLARDEAHGTDKPLGSAPPSAWPPTCDLFGVRVSATTYREAIDAVLAAAAERSPACVSALAVHGLMTATEDDAFCIALNQFAMLTPDGQPIRLALNLLYRAGLPERVYGPELMLRICERAASASVGIYLYGSYPEVVTRLRARLAERFPGLSIVGGEPSLFRPLTKEEDEALVERINASGAGVLFVGLGCPLQERFAHAHRTSIRAVQVCVGAGFDFLSGTKPMAPAWMQRYALEWLFRLINEPRRLWRRYTKTNWAFLVSLARAYWQSHHSPASAVPPPADH